MHAVEIDPVLAAALPATVAERAPDARRPADRPQRRRAAARRGRPATPAPTALVANLPYNVAVPVVLHLLAELPTLRHGLVMVQKEVADRLTAAPGLAGSTASRRVKLAWYAAARPAGRVPPTVFWPVPNVDSGLVAFARREPPPPASPASASFAVVDAAFAQRRKTLRVGAGRLGRRRRPRGRSALVGRRASTRARAARR